MLYNANSGYFYSNTNMGYSCAFHILEGCSPPNQFALLLLIAVRDKTNVNGIIYLTTIHQFLLYSYCIYKHDLYCALPLFISLFTYNKINNNNKKKLKKFCY